MRTEMHTEATMPIEKRTRGLHLAAGAVAGGALVALAATPAARAAFASQPDVSAGADSPSASAAVAEQSTTVATPHRTVANVEGTFAWNQGVSADNATLARLLYGASDVLCGSQANDALPVTLTGGGAAFAIAEIAVTGDVENPLVASIDAYEEKAPMRTVLGCTCAGNPADGLASANAAVEGFELRALIADAQPVDGANAITFVCADSYEATLPLSYVLQRYAVVVSSVNGEATSDALGCANQVWLGTTSAPSFARDVVEIRITAEEAAPPAPGAPEGANLPNVGVVAGSVGAAV